MVVKVIGIKGVKNITGSRRQEELRDQGIALKDFKTLGEAMDQYHKITGIELMSFKTYSSKYQGANDESEESDKNEIIELVFGLGGVYTTILIFYHYY